MTPPAAVSQTPIQVSDDESERKDAPQATKWSTGWLIPDIRVGKKTIESHSMINKRLVSESRANKLDQQALLLEQDIQDRIAKREQEKVLFDVEVELRRGKAERDFALRQRELDLKELELKHHATNLACKVGFLKSSEKNNKQEHSGSNLLVLTHTTRNTHTHS